MAIMLKAWTGPCAVHDAANALRYGCELPGVIEGTEHVYVPIEATSADDATTKLADVITKYAPTLRWLEFRNAR
jgi:hypothetical protein